MSKIVVVTDLDTDSKEVENEHRYIFKEALATI